MVERLKNDMVKAMKEKDKERLTVIRMVKAAVDLEHIDKKREYNDELVIDVVNREIKSRKDSIVEFEKANRFDLVEKTQRELEILQEYLPPQLTKEEVKEAIDKIFASIKPEGPKDMGKLMKEATSTLKGKTDMKEVSDIIREKLQ